MSNQIIKHQVLDEIDQIPEDKLADLYQIIHYFRLGLTPSNKPGKQAIMEFAGSWQDMPQATFSEFLADIGRRRQQAFSGRQDHASFID